MTKEMRVSQSNVPRSQQELLVLLSDQVVGNSPDAGWGGNSENPLLITELPALNAAINENIQ